MNLSHQIPNNYATNPRWIAFLSSVQANIVKHHGRKYAHFIFIRFNEPNQTTAVKQWLAGFSDHITSAFLQLQTQKGDKGDVLCTCLISREGANWLQLKRLRFPTMAYEQLYELTDENQENIEGNYKAGSHVMILVAHDELQKIEVFTQEKIKGSLKKNNISYDIFSEKGGIMHNAEGKHIEPFGFQDGLSQPELLRSKSKKKPKSKWNSAAGLSCAFCKRRIKGVSDYGAYAVYLKIKQDINLFNANVETVAQKINDPNLDEKGKKELAAAYMMGRFRDGTPVVLSNTPKKTGQPAGDGKNYDIPGVPPNKPKEEATDNDFNYDDHGAENKCPFFAHIYKANPRTKVFKKVRIIRRGIPFESKDGIHFLSYQRDIDAQFMKMYKDWMANPFNPASAERFGKDAIVMDDFPGKNPVPEDVAFYSPIKKIPEVWGEYPGRNSVVAARLEKPTFVKGAVFFYVPSLYFLKNLPAL